MSQHDDGSHPAMYDLLVQGATAAAAEVGLVIDRKQKEAHAHWSKYLRGRTTGKLRRRWHFMFGDEFTPAAVRTRYPHQPPPAAEQLESVLACLEARSINQIGSMWGHGDFTGKDFEIADQDVRNLFELLGRAANHASSSAVPPGERGGWSFVFGSGGASRGTPDELLEDVQQRLCGPEWSDLRHKLAASNQDRRVAVLVYDTSTAVGWGLHHWAANQIPSATLTLPSEVTDLVVIGPGDFVLHYRSPDWRRVDVNAGS